MRSIKTALMICIVVVVGQSVTAQVRTFTKDMRFHHFQSEILSRDQKLLVMLPPNYQDDAPWRYPVLYMQDGQSVFANWRIDEITQPMFTAGQIQKIIIVAIFNGGSQEARFDDYTPTRDIHYSSGGKGDAYGRMIVEELKPIIDGEYRTLSGPATTAIGGVSLGGLISIYLALKYPNVFGKAAVVSPSVWWDNGFIVRHVKKSNAKPALKIWLDVGKDEGARSIADTRTLRDALIKAGWKQDSDLKYHEAKGGEHNEEAFARRVPEILAFLFPPISGEKAATAKTSIRGVALIKWQTDAAKQFFVSRIISETVKDWIHF